MDDERDLDEELEPTEAELREAAALHAALDGAPAREAAGAGPADAAPEDALQAAALLWASRAGELSELRERAVRQRVLEGAPEPAAIEAGTEEEDEVDTGVRWLRWVAPAATVAAAAALMLVFVPADRPAATELPSPGAGLLRAQAAAAKGEGAEAAMLQAGMRRFRSRYLAALERRYGGER